MVKMTELKNEQFNKLDRRILMLEEQIKNIDEKLDMLTGKIDKGFCDIGKTYVRKDTYSKDLQALTRESESQSKRIDAINKLMWFLISAVLAFVIAGLLESTFLVR